MIVGRNGNRAARPLWVTGLAQLRRVRHPQHRALGEQAKGRSERFSIAKNVQFSAAIDTPGKSPLFDTPDSGCHVLLIRASCSGVG